jgi:phosphatidate cytidylyltransferase
LPGPAKPAARLCVAGVILMTLANWLPHVLQLFHAADAGKGSSNPWQCIGGWFAVLILAAFLAEMATFLAPGESVKRIALTVWIVAYLGFLPSFLTQLRWLPDLNGETTGKRATVALALAIFVPKCCDIGAYFTGRLLGRHPLAPVLSPKKTWEGAGGGLAASMLAAVVIERCSPVPVLEGGAPLAGALGLSVGAAGMLGDLAESLMKRDSGQKDASQVVPGFGGVLDVVDSIIFASPVAYFWLA